MDTFHTEFSEGNHNEELKTWNHERIENVKTVRAKDNQEVLVDKKLVRIIYNCSDSFKVVY